MKSVASTPKGKSVYAITDKTNGIVKIAYDLYGPRQEGETKKTIEQFVADNGIVVWTDDYGALVVFQSDTYGPAAECGKPVVYLYPTKTTTVSVSLGARVTKSDPIYHGGWQVVAEPNGTLHVGGKTYNSLFWEGLGYGMYPSITTGTVVKRDQAESTIEQNLHQMGLNAKETADFMAFWAPKLPSSAYVRLTWLQNAAMDRLAPLTVTPRPDSTIRVFLDFAGMDHAVAMPTQALKSYPRSGFTVVEWGGLLR